MATTAPHPGEEGPRRDFIFVAAISASAVGAGLAVWPFVNSMNPSRDVLAEATAEVDLTPIEEGQRITVLWRKKPVFIDHRAPAKIEEAEGVALGDLKDPQADADRVQRKEWLVLIGICTHLGCIPQGQRVGERLGDFGGWFCPCHGSHYDTSGRIRKGPAPKNLDVPPYSFISDTTIQLG
ncbi:MAG: ubiquinol-cytochrome c reductase iron-sulfur subunit [Proteobacteria bacterium]|nr:ubiquinol-cytochrome c reductase iron-sulfur subunit [Pseudomonadota bacterium]